MSGFAEDYVPVSERLEQFYGTFPSGSIQAEIVTHTDALVVVRATVYRTPDDIRPSIAHSQLSIPGKTPYTRGSELENAETSAIGRAIAFLGFDVHRGVASRDEVQAKSGPVQPVPAAVSSADAGLLKELLVAAKERGIKQYMVARELGIKDPERMTSEALRNALKAHGPRLLGEWLEADGDRSLDSLLDGIQPEEAA